ncbi:flagellar biosynthesis protein FliS [Lysinibacillus contaminans]|uniref:Flagellar biosynthesis protein FliS n=1 Tax=Lysinibacillus contaminans TaxID=1293441 RepID=A0ABR5JWZ3_9BACI|nr:PilZ domain-containing protein [Lysinibacillus contaminans]KOS66687.1 flagellar biosynthesis protein FliS [Lysinibacillus contaminans]
MFFKRTEGFRYKFEEPLQTTFTIVENGRAVKDEAAIGGILDISPKGIKMFSTVDLNAGKALSPQLEIRFIIDSQIIVAYGEVMWSRPYMNGKQYGIFFNNQVLIEGLIVEELKIRRKKEIMATKKLKSNA